MYIRVCWVLVYRSLLSLEQLDGLRVFRAALVRIDIREQDRLQPRLAAHAAAAARRLSALEPLATRRQVQIPEENRLHASLTLSSCTALRPPLFDSRALLYSTRLHS